MKKYPGFTLMELIIVIFIIGIIAGTITVSYQAVREKTRDTKRLNDITQIQNALELYARDEGEYPLGLNFGQTLIGSTTGISYLTTVPSNPLPRNDGSCPDSEYGYNIAVNQASYTINFCLGRTHDAIPAGQHCATPKGIENQACQ